MKLVWNALVHTMPWAPTVEAGLGRTRLNHVLLGSSGHNSPTPTQPSADSDELELQYPLNPMQTDMYLILAQSSATRKVPWAPPEGTVAVTRCYTYIFCARELCKAAGVDVGIAARWCQEAEQHATVNPTSVTIDILRERNV